MGTLPNAWHDTAACRNANPDLFFPVRTDPYEMADAVAKAKAVCRACPVRLRCLRASLDAPAMEYGIWGGLAEQDRARARRQYRRGKPPEVIIAEDDARFYARLEAAA